jgi:hypothetical protein
MSVDAKAANTGRKWLSIDSWAVLTAFVLALLIRAGVFKHIPW